ncbi:phytanoyl-CoA dioxygenase family protein [Pseudomonadales bacterium]|nr:phytanoyl-CoA dioxygenase family protein [Pseudomonadales bacterium]
MASVKILTRDQSARYHKKGYCAAEGLVDSTWLARLNAVTHDFIEESRGVTASNARFDLEPDHTAAAPRLRRLNAPVDQHETYWEFASTGPFADIAEDLLGPNVKFHHSKLNFKWSGGGESVKWHQDIQFWPHTNYDVLTIGVYLSDVTQDMAPIGIIPGSHDHDLFDLYDAQGRWTGHIQDEDLPALDVDRAEYLMGPAGTITVHNCRAVHGSPPNHSASPRPLLLCAYSASDAMPITTLTAGSPHAEVVIRGERSKWARFDPRPVLMPPDWSKGYQSIFQYQQGEEAR